MRRLTLILALVSSWPTVAAAQVTFDEALAIAPQAPAAQGARRALRARRAGDEDIGGTAERTTLTVMPGAVLTPDQDRGFDLQINATQGWNLGNLGGARRDAASRERQALAAEARADALRTRLDAARRWIDLHTFESLDALLERQDALARRLVETTERGVQAGVATAADLADVRAALAELGQRWLELEGNLVEARLQLAVALGREAGASIRTAGPLPAPELPDAPAIQALLESVDELPTVVALRLAETAARARETEASAHYAPILQVGAQLERGSTDSWVLYGVAGISFAGFGQGNRDASLARAETERAASDVDAARLRARADLAAAVHDVEHTRAQLEGIEARLLPPLESLSEQRERALELGEGTVFAVLVARRRVLRAQELRARAIGARLWAEMHMWLLLSELERGAEVDP